MSRNLIKIKPMNATLLQRHRIAAANERNAFSATSLQRRMSETISQRQLQRPISVTLSQRHCTAAAKRRNALEASLLALLRQPLQLAFIIQCARSCIYLSICFHLSYITHSRNFEKKQTGPMATWYIYEKCTISRKKKEKEITVR